jgi:hypothetical protein
MNNSAALRGIRRSNHPLEIRPVLPRSNSSSKTLPVVLRAFGFQLELPSYWAALSGLRFAYGSRSSETDKGDPDKTSSFVIMVCIALLHSARRRMCALTSSPCDKASPPTYGR